MGFDPDDFEEKRLSELSEESGDEAKDAKSRLSFSVSSGMEGRGNSGFDDLANEFSRK